MKTSILCQIYTRDKYIYSFLDLKRFSCLINAIYLSVFHICLVCFSLSMEMGITIQSTMKAIFFTRYISKIESLNFISKNIKINTIKVRSKGKRKFHVHFQNLKSPGKSKEFNNNYLNIVKKTKAKLCFSFLNLTSFRSQFHIFFSIFLIFSNIVHTFFLFQRLFFIILFKVLKHTLISYILFFLFNILPFCLLVTGCNSSQKTNNCKLNLAI